MCARRLFVVFFSLVGSSDVFEVDARGFVKVRSSLSNLRGSHHKLMVKATDNGRPPNSSKGTEQSEMQFFLLIEWQNANKIDINSLALIYIITTTRLQRSY